MKGARGKTFSAQRIELCNRKYEHCTFVACIIVYDASGPFHLERNHFQNCQWVFEGVAADTVAFLKHMQAMGADDVVRHTLGYT